MDLSLLELRRALLDRMLERQTQDQASGGSFASFRPKEAFRGADTSPAAELPPERKRKSTKKKQKRKDGPR